MKTPGPETSHPPSKDQHPGPSARGILISLGLTIFLCILALCQQFYGIGLTTRLEIPRDRIQQLPDSCRWKLPEPYRSPLMARRAAFFENDLRWINLARANRDLKDLGPGWFHWVDGGVNFVPRDPRHLDDPSIRYSVLAPLQFKPRVWWILGSLLLFQLILYNRLHPAPPRFLSPDGFFHHSASKPGWSCELAVFACALTAIFAGLLSNHDPTDHAFMVKGIPESDALAWYEMSVGLSEGRGLGGGFQNQRPFYSIYLGGLFSFFGVRLSVAQGFNALCLAASAAGIFSVGRLLHSRWLGLVLCISAMTATTHLDYVHALISENSGIVLAVLSLLSAWRAAWSLSLPSAFIAGLLNGLAALSSGVTLFTLPLYAVIVFLFPLSRRVPWRRALHIGLLYTLAASLVVAPWIIRQKVVNDRLTLSYNTAEVLAGGADPRSGKLGHDLFADAARAGIDLSDANARYDFFIQSFKRFVAEDPARYLRRLSTAFLDSIRDLPSRVAGFQLTLLLGLFGFGLWPALIRGQWLAVPFAALLMTLWARSGFDVTPLMLAAAAFLSWRRTSSPPVRLAVLLLVATVLATMALAALSGNIATKRFWLVSDWAAFALLLAGSKYLVVSSAALAHNVLGRAPFPRWFAGRPHPPGPFSTSMSPPPFVSSASLAWLAFTAVCAAATLARQFHPPPPPFAGLDQLDPPALARQGLARSGPETSKFASLPPGSLAVHLAFLSDLHASFDSGEGTQHWMEVYSQRPYPRWVAKFSLLMPDGSRGSPVNAIGQGSLDAVPRRTPLLVLGAFTNSVNRISKNPARILEVLLIIPLRRSSPDAPWQPDFASQITFPPTPEALATLNAAAPAASPLPPAPASTLPAPAPSPAPPSPASPPSSPQAPPPPPQ